MEIISKKILIIEDDLPILKGIADKFELEGFSVISAKDGEEGLSYALKERPDLIILDYRMPKMDGFAMLEKLRADEWGKTALVIMWSNSYSSDTKNRAKALGAIDFLVKSDWEYKDVVRKVRQVLGI